MRNKKLAFFCVFLLVFFHAWSATISLKIKDFTPVTCGEVKSLYPNDIFPANSSMARELPRLAGSGYYRNQASIAANKLTYANFRGVSVEKIRSSFGGIVPSIPATIGMDSSGITKISIGPNGVSAINRGVEVPVTYMGTAYSYQEAAMAQSFVSHLEVGLIDGTDVGFDFLDENGNSMNMDQILGYVKSRLPEFGKGDAKVDDNLLSLMLYVEGMIHYVNHSPSLELLDPKWANSLKMLDFCLISPSLCTELGIADQAGKSDTWSLNAITHANENGSGIDLSSEMTVNFYVQNDDASLTKQSQAGGMGTKFDSYFEANPAGQFYKRISALIGFMYSPVSGEIIDGKRDMVRSDLDIEVVKGHISRILGPAPTIATKSSSICNIIYYNIDDE